MPEWTTPLLRPLAWRPGPASFSSTAMRAAGQRRRSACATERPTMPAPITAKSTCGGSEVSVPRVADHRETLQQLPDAVIQRHRGPVPRLLDLLVRDDVVALIGILGQGRLHDREVRH